MKKVKISALGALNEKGWANRAYTEIPFNKVNDTTGANLGIKPSAGMSFAIIHLDEQTSRTVKVGDELNVHPIADFTGFISYEIHVKQGVKNTTASKDASMNDTMIRSTRRAIITLQDPEIAKGIASLGIDITSAFTSLASTANAELNASKNAGKTARKGLRGNGLQPIAVEDAITDIPNPKKK